MPILHFVKGILPRRAGEGSREKLGHFEEGHLCSRRTPTLKKIYQYFSPVGAITSHLWAVTSVVSRSFEPVYMYHIPLLRRREAEVLLACNHFRNHADSHTLLPLSPSGQNSFFKKLYVFKFEDKKPIKWALARSWARRGSPSRELSRSLT